MNPKNSSRIDQILIFLVILDIVLFVATLFFPDFWFKVFHGIPYQDPASLLRRTGGVWVAFTLLQFIALLRWKEQPHWLVLIAGVRWTELFSDWIYLGMAQQVTWFGKAGLFIAPIVNGWIGWYLIKTYLNLQPNSSRFKN